MLVGSGERFYVRKSPQESLEIRNDRRHLRLLQHDLADPDCIQIACPPPRQIAGAVLEPDKQLFIQRSPPGGLRHSDSRLSFSHIAQKTVPPEICQALAA